MMQSIQATVVKSDPTAARAAWHEATETLKIASLRATTADEAVTAAEQKIRHATQNEVLQGKARDTLADLGQELADRMIRAEEADAAKKRCQKELKIAWAAWQPFAAAEARGAQATRIPRVSVLLAAARSSPAPTSTPRSPDPTYPAGASFPVKAAERQAKRRRPSA